MTTRPNGANQDRGRFLSIMLIVGVIFGLGTVTILVPAIAEEVYPDLPDWHYLYWSASLLVYFAALLLIYRWKKLGFYLLILVSLSDSVVQVYLDLINQQGLIGLDFYLTSFFLYLWYRAIRPKWSNFQRLSF